MFRYLFVVAFTLLLAASFTGCESRKKEHSKTAIATNHSTKSDSPDRKTLPPATTKVPFRDSMQPLTYELPSGALATWRKFAASKPALLLFANHPLLTPIPKDRLSSVRKLIDSGLDAEIIRRGRTQAPNPAFLPPETVSVAIDAGLISELIYVLPSKLPLDKFSLKDFQERALRAGFITPQEAKTLSLKAGVISGTVRGIPFRCVHPEALPKLAKPVLVHIDLGYFSDLYVNGVKTPPYNLLHNLIEAIQKQDYSALAVTLSYSNQEVGFSLGTRFMISNLAEILRHPSLLQGGTPASWTLRADALLRREMYDDSAAKDLFRQAAKVNPEDPAALYDLAMTTLEARKTKEGFQILDRAVALDPGYGEAYLELANTGLKLRHLDKTIELLQKAAKVFPEAPLIRMNLGDLLIQQGRLQEARPLIQELRELPWSEKFHPGTAKALKTMEEVIASGPVIPAPPPDK